VTGAISQITELRAGHNRQMVVLGVLVTIFKDAPGGSLINDRSIPTDNTLTPPFKGAKLQERVPPLLTARVVGGGSPLLREPQTVQTFRTSLNTLGDGFVEAVPNSSLIAISNSQSTITGGVVHGQAIMVPVLEANPSTNRECQNPSLRAYVASAASAGRINTPACCRSRVTPTATRWASPTPRPLREHFAGALGGCLRFSARPRG
jgi:hypothetical protein